MKRFVFLLAMVGSSWAIGASCADKNEVVLNFIETSDVHGSYFPYNFITRTPQKGSLARLSSLVNERRSQYKDALILVDNGDILQGQPIAYYYNYMDTKTEHVCASMLNYLHYDLGTMGNHDVEPGHAVYDRWIRQCKFPILGANIIDIRSGNPYLPPYKILERKGVKIAVLGMITPSIPSWLPEQLWSGLRFDDMEATARRWVDIIRKKEKPDLLIGLFHAGPEGNDLGGVIENGSELVARNVPGFDVVFMGHDHQRHLRKVLNVAGDSVLIAGPANAARAVSDVTIKIVKKNGKILKKEVFGKLTELDNYPIDKAFMEHFDVQYRATLDFVSRKIGSISETISSKDAFFGPSAFIDLLHQLQLNLTGADISFCAPLSPTAEIKKGDIYMSDMFNLYKYENMLYTMKLSGKEIKGFLEMSYALWTNQMKSASDHLLLLNDKDTGFGRFKNPTFNFDSAAGILYTVDVTKPEGSRIDIKGMADGTPFDMTKMYKVAVNSYRGNGGGDLLTKGAGIPKDELKGRIIASTEKDLRYYLMQQIEKMGHLDPKPLNQWKFIPEEWVEQAAKRDYEIAFKGSQH